MKREYLTVRPSTEKGLPFHIKIYGFEGLHYEAEDVLAHVAHELVNKCAGSLVIYRDKLLEDQKPLKKALETMIAGHNMALLIGTKHDMPACATARKILREYN